MIDEPAQPVNRLSTNVLRMPFAEWLYRMHEAAVPAAARVLAVYAAVFQISNNDELRLLAGQAESTYLTHKRTLLKDGWVIVKSGKGGRGLGIEVCPAYKETPVKFTDVSPRNPSKFNHGNEEEVTPVIFTPVSKKTPLISTDTPKETPVNSGALSPPLACAENNYARSDSNIKNNINNSNNYACASNAARARESAGSDELVTVNGVAIHGPNFSLDFAAIDMAASLVGADKQRARQIAEMCARDWAVNPNNMPRNPMAQVRGAITADFQRGRSAAAAPDKTESRATRMRRFAKEARERAQAQKARRNVHD